MANTLKDQRAQSTAEFVVVFPMLLLLLFAMIEFGWMLKNFLVVTNTTREVARYAAVNRCNHDGALLTAEGLAAQRLNAGAGIHGDDDILFSIHYIDEDFSGDQNRGDSLIVCIESPSRHVTPLLAFSSMVGVLPNPVPLRARTEMRVEVAYDGGDGSDLIASGASSCTPS